MGYFREITKLPIYKLLSSNTANLNYLSVPILVKYAIQSSGFSVSAGPQIGLLLSAKYGDTDIKSNLKGTDFSGVIGVEYALPMGIIFSARYQIGFANVGKSSTTSGSGYSYNVSDNIKNNALSITVGYALGKSK